MYKEIPKTERLRILTTGEALSRLANSNLLKFSQEVTRFGSVLTDVELQTLREEMIKDGAYMKAWLASKSKKNLR